MSARVCLVVAMLLVCLMLGAWAEEGEDSLLAPVQFTPPVSEWPINPQTSENLLLAQDSQSGLTPEDLIPPIDTDRGNWPNCAAAVPLGSVQLETGMQWDWNPGGTHTTDFPETLMRMGILPKTEFRVYSPDYYSTPGTGQYAYNWGNDSISVCLVLGTGSYADYNSFV